MRLRERLKNFLKKRVFVETWTCNACEKEIFNDKFVCDACAEKLEYIGSNSCAHCGRTLIKAQDYCTTCKGKLVSTTFGKSVYNYKDTASILIQRFKYKGAKYMADYFAKEMSNIYFKHYYATDYLAFVPATKKTKNKRGYNQGELLAVSLSKIVGVPVFYGLEKVKHTERQAKLDKADRLKNLKGSFKITDKKAIKGKSVTIIDDVTTTGATLEMLASVLLKAGAKEIKYITIASVPPKSGY